MRTFRRLIQVAGLTAAGFVGLVGAASAQVVNTDVGLNQSFLQTSDTTTDTINAFFSARVFFTTAGDYTTGTLTLPSTDTRTLADQGYIPPLEIGYQDTQADLATLQATYGTGTYTFDVSGGTQPEAIVSQDYAGNAFPNVPLVTNLSALQGVSTSDYVYFDFNGMDVSPNATPGENNLYFYVYNATTNALIYASGPEDPNVSAIGLLGYLSAGTSYYFNLVYDDRIVDTSDPSITKTQFYDIGTTGFFTTAAGAVPEPSTWAMLLVGFGGIGFMIRRRAAGLRVKAV